MAGTREPPSPFESRPAGSSEPPSLLSNLPLSSRSSISFTALSPTTESTNSDNTLGRPVETITMTTLHGMLEQILEQTNALWRAQASTNHILDELRQSMPAPQEIDERLRRVEALAGTLAHSQRVDLHPPAQSGQGTGASSSAHQGRSFPQSIPQPSFPRNVGEASSCDAPANPRSPLDPVMSTQETTHHMGSVLPAGDNLNPTLGPSVSIYHNKDGDEVPPSSHIDQSTADPVISPGQTRLLEPQHGSERATVPFASEIEDDGDEPQGVVDHHVASTSCIYVPSEPVSIGSEDALYARQEQPGAGCGPSVPPPQDSDEFSTVEPPQSATQDPTSKHTFDLPEVIQKREQMPVIGEPIATVREHQSDHKLDDKRQLPFAEENVPRVAVAEPVEALRNQLADLANFIRQKLAPCGEKKALMEQQWPEGLDRKEGWDPQIRELMEMASLLVEDRAMARQREEHQRQADGDNPRIEQANESQKQYVERRELLQFFSDTCRADSARQYAKIINAVRATANEQVPFNVQGYLDEFSKALSDDVRMLLNEVGKLREERRRIHELGYLMRMQSTFAPGGEFGDWPPEYSSPHTWPSPAGIPLPESPQPRPGWRTVPLRRHGRAPRPEPPPPPERQVHSWVTWQPNPALAPTPPSVEPALLVPDHGSPGLFGPRSPHGSFRVLPREIEEPNLPNLYASSWFSWRPDPAFAPTPPSVEPTLLVPDRGSPGIFGPRSP